MKGGPVDTQEQPIVEARAITKIYQGGVRSLDAVSMQVMAGEVYGLVGPNGAGKTTLMRVLAGIVTPTSGSFRIGSDMERVTVGALIDVPEFYPSMTGHRNLTLLCTFWGIPRRAADEALDRVGLSERDRHRTYRQYSLGMRQRLGVAAALLASPRVVVLDEPTNGLDPESIVKVRDLVCELRDSGCAVLLSSHQLREVELVADRLGVLMHGKLIAEGTIDDLRRDLSRRRVEAEVDDAERALEVAQRLGVRATVNADKPFAVTFDDRVPSHEINRALVGAGVNVSALTHVQESFESAILTLLIEPHEQVAAHTPDRMERKAS